MRNLISVGAVRRSWVSRLRETPSRFVVSMMAVQILTAIIVAAAIGSVGTFGRIPSIVHGCDVFNADFGNYVDPTCEVFKPVFQFAQLLLVVVRASPLLLVVDLLLMRAFRRNFRFLGVLLALATFSFALAVCFHGGALQN